ncbi:Pectate lyase superfamily protein [Caballeronia concitans]|uniref:Pectate lyase superfamily protein n=2 Tax=Caballeronia concitans TaxID=1777133 RepID=A0A658QTB8_9BURK|nr:hypothetical protein BurMR1_2214 [Burkholderia sp. MR1]SAL19894.1 Pectate lyase superfamily protein [Caballeronia concitans]
MIDSGSRTRRRRWIFRLPIVGMVVMLPLTNRFASAATTESDTSRAQWANPRDFGAIADGASHPLSSRYATLAAARSVYPFAAHLMQEIDFCAIQAAILSGAPVSLSSGRFRVDDTVYIPSGTVIAGEGDSTVLIWTRSVHSSDVFSMFLAERVTRIQMTDFSVADVSGSVGGYVVVGYNVRQLTIARVSTTGMAVAAFMPARDAYDSYDRVNIDENDVRFNGSASLAVSQCNARDVARSDSPRAAVLLRYCTRWSVVDCTFLDVPFGVQWWGGDSNPRFDGASTKQRKCMYGTVTNVKTANCIAGVWGSMGQGVTVSRCNVENATDVGIDFEGCVDCVASENEVSRCANGNFTIFGLNLRITMVGNTSTQFQSNFPHLRVYNETQGVENRSLNVEQNKFSTNGAVGSVDTDHGCVESLNFTGNQLADTRIHFVANNLRWITVADNVMTFTRPIPTPSSAVEIGQIHNGGQVVVERNSIVSSVVQQSSTPALYLWSDDYNYDANFHVSGNRIMGFSIDLITDNFGRNSGVTSNFLIEKNALPSGIYRKYDHGARRSRSVLRGNSGVADWTSE